MKRLLLTFAVIFIFVLCVAPAKASITTDTVNQSGFSKLSESQKAAIIKQIADKVEAQTNSVTGSGDPEKVDKWLNIGERIGKMMGGAAKEVGVAVNEFVKTPVGMTTMAIIVWNYMGAMIAHFIGALLVLVTGLSALLYIARKSEKVVTVYHPEKTTWLGNARKVSVVRSPLQDPDAYALCAGVVIVVSMIVMFTY